MRLVIGSIEHGPELEHSPLAQAIKKLAHWSASIGGLGDGSVEVVFDVPGSLGGSETSGVDLRRARGPRRSLVFVEVPPSLATSSDPTAKLLELLRGALVDLRDAAKVPDARSEVEDLLARLPTQVNPSDVTGHERRAYVEDSSPMLVLGLPAPTRGAILAALDLMGSIEAALDAENLGHVDGNDVGDVSVRIYIVPRRIKDALALIAAAVADWPHGKATIDRFQ